VEEIDRLSDRVAALESQMQAVLARLDLARSVPQAVPDADELLPLLRDGKTIDAIKVYRERTGLGLAEAKDEIDRLKQRYGL
jgi:ribosomal protein L7/L12